MKPRKIPMRMCVGCRQMQPKRDLLRVVRAKEGEISLDTTGKKPGRGAYICQSQTCLARAVKTRQLERALEHPIDQAIFDGLTEAVSQQEAMKAQNG